MDRIRIAPGPAYPGDGISRGLARGLLVYDGDRNITGEGMGIGSVACRDGESTYFSRSWTDVQEDGVLRRTFVLDTRMIWGIRGQPSPILTRGIETGIGAYMRLPRIQGVLMLAAQHIRPLAGIHPQFEAIPPRGTVTFTYRVTGHEVEVRAESCSLPGPGETLCLLNELSAARFTAGWDGRRPAAPPPGWEAVGPDRLPVSLADPVHGIRFWMDRPSASPGLPLSFFRGRELIGDLCWAGFCIELGPGGGLRGFPEVRYRIGLATGDCP